MASFIQRGPTYYIQYMASGKARRVSTGTESLQIAKEKLRQFESAQARGDESPLPTLTPITDVVSAYVSHIRTVKTAKSAQTDIYYLSDAFGPMCDALNVLQMVKRRAKALGLPRDIRCHSFRATGITAYLKNDGTIERAQAIAAHESPRTTKLYDRTSNEVTLDEIERITI